MCKHLVSLVYRKRVGSAIRKAVLGYMADRANEEGDGIYTSKGRIARETEVSPSSVKRTIKDLLEEGVLVEVGKKHHANGETVIYAICREAVEAFPDAKEDTTSCATQATVDPVHGEPGPQGTPTRSTVNPHPVHGEPQTTLNHLEPPKKDQPSQGDLVVVPTFDEFWSKWGLRKTSKKECLGVFRRLSAEKKIAATQNVARWCVAWKQANPTANDIHPVRYLRNERWEDEFAKPSQQSRPISDRRGAVIPSQQGRQIIPPSRKEAGQ